MDSQSPESRSAGKESLLLKLVHRFLRIFTVIHPGEAPKVFLLAANVFLILFAYYLIKPIRNALILTSFGPRMQSYLGAAQAILIIFVIKAFSRLASRVPRHILIAWVTLFFISNLVIFYFLNVFAVPMGTIGIVFYIWIGIFNLLVVAQFWGFANDLYTENIGKRLFPLIAFGGNLGALFGPQVNKVLAKSLGLYEIMLVCAGILGVCILFSVMIHKREIKKAGVAGISGRADADSQKRIQEQPLEKGGGFRLVFKSRYLLYIALLIGIYNYINATGEYMFGDIQTRTAHKALETGAAAGMSMEKYINSAFADYQSLSNLLAVLIQLFLVSRIFRWVGIGGALLFLPLIVLGGYGYTALGASLVVLKWVKSAENGTDYSLMNTTKAALFLKTSREEKYKAKAAIDTFFVRGGDTLSALTIFLGTTFLAMKIEGFAMVNICGILVWIFLAILIIREYKKLRTPQAEISEVR